MEKVLRVLLAFFISFSMTACGNEQPDEPSNTPDTSIEHTVDNNNDSSELLMIRQSLIETPYVLGVAYLGQFDEEVDDLEDYLEETGLDESFSFILDLSDDQFVTFEGQELYLLVPRDEDAQITVYDWVVDEYNEYSGEAGDMRFSAEGEAVLVLGNRSEIVPNFVVEVVCQDGTELWYTPCLSGFDGLLETPDEENVVFDLTPYEFFDFFPSASSFDESTLWMAASWDTEVYTLDDQYLSYSFTFYDEGGVSFCYGPADETIEVYYEGIIMKAEDEFYPEDTFVMEFYLDENYSSEDVPNYLYTVVQLSWYEDGNGLVMMYVDGEPLNEKEVDIEYLLYPSMG